ncbi:MAG TPA: MFS transporter [Bacteroidota bacterium]|nr:MFS transporter [Bacteroidota bacterium]
MINIILLGLTSLFTDVASEMVYPLVPFFLLGTLGAGPALLGLIEGIAESIASLLKVFSGYISDRLGKRKGLTIVGYAASALGKITLAAAAQSGTVFCARALDRLGKGIRTAPRDALIAESAQSGTSGRAFGLHRAMDSAGAVIGVLLAYLIIAGGANDYRRVFLWSIVPALLGVALLFRLADPARNGGRPAQLPQLRWRILPRKLRRFLLVAFLFALGNSSNAFLLLRSSEAGVTTQQVLLLYLVYNCFYALSSYPAGKVADLLGQRVVLVTGYCLYGLVYLGFTQITPAGAHWLPWLLFAVYGLYSGLTDGVEKALVSELAPVEVRASAMGVHASIVGFGLLPASLIAGALYQRIGPDAPFILGGTLGLAASAGIAIALRQGRNFSA